MDFDKLTPADIISGGKAAPAEKGGAARMLDAFKKAQDKAQKKRKAQKPPSGPRMGMIALGPDAPDLESREEAAVAFLIGTKMQQKGVEALHKFGELTAEDMMKMTEAVDIIRSVFEELGKRVQARCEAEHEHDENGECLGPKDEDDGD